jgi:hypoxanthine phosphoribosyltransferase
VNLDSVQSQITQVLVTEDQIKQRVAELAAEIDKKYAGKEVLLVGVLKGAVMFMADLSRALNIESSMEWMALSSYGSGTVSSGVIRILKDLDSEIHGKHVIIVEDIIDSGLTLSWLCGTLESRGAASVEVVAFLRKPAAAKVEVPVWLIGFDIPNEFVVGYGLDYNERFRTLNCVAVLDPKVYS